MDVNALSQLYGSDRWPRRAELDGRCERFVIPDALFDGAGFRLVWRDALPGARHSYRSFYHRDDDCRLMVDVFAASSFDDAKRELLAGFYNCTSLVRPRLCPSSATSPMGIEPPSSSCAEICWLAWRMQALWRSTSDRSPSPSTRRCRIVCIDTYS